MGVKTSPDSHDNGRGEGGHGKRELNGSKYFQYVRRPADQFLPTVAPGHSQALAPGGSPRSPADWFEATTPTPGAVNTAPVRIDALKYGALAPVRVID